MIAKTTPKEIWQEYENAKSFKNAIDLYENVRINENFYNGRQWEGVNAPDLPKPVLNFLKRPVSYAVAMIVSDDVAISFTANTIDPKAEAMAAIVADQVERINEQAGVKALNRDKVRDAAVDGDGIIHKYFDAEAETGQNAKGEIRTESIESINFHPGNPYIHSIQDQPYLIIGMRKMVGEVQDEAKEEDIPEDQIDLIRPDSDGNQGERGDSTALVTVLIKYWRENGTVWAIKTTENAVVKAKWNTGLKLYPVANMRWEKVKSQFFGQAMLTGLITNQISVNRLFAMTIHSVELSAFPKIIYSKQRFKDGWNNQVGQAIGVDTMLPNEKVMDVVRGGDVSGQVTEIIERVVTMTRDFMGTSDAALGNVQPDNTSAIIATQKATAVPLQLQQREYYDYVETGARIDVDMMRANYGKRQVMVDDQDILAKLKPDEKPQDGVYQPSLVEVDFGAILENANLKLNVDVGGAAYWDEFLQTNETDNLFKAGVIRDMEVYVESIPRHILPNKNKILQSIRHEKQAAAQQGQLQAQMEAQNSQGTPSPEAAIQ